jgi:hypothetical protein
MPSFRLVHVSGEDLGVKSFAVPDWKPRDDTLLGGGNLRVVDVAWHDEDDEVAGTLTVEAVAYWRVSLAG